MEVISSADVNKSKIQKLVETFNKENSSHK